MIMDRTYAIENLKRICYGFTNGTVAYDMPVLEDGDIIDLRSTEDEIREALEKVKEQALKNYDAAEIVEELIQPYGKYASNVHTMARTSEDQMYKHAKKLWKQLHAKYVTDSMPMTEAALNGFKDMTFSKLAENTRLIVYHAQHDLNKDYEEILETILA